MTPILNIFSKKRNKKIKIEKPKIIIDYREKNSLVASELVSLGTLIEFRELKVADYVVKDVVIERKTISDFINSMIRGRLNKQIEELQQYKNKLLIIEGFEEQELYSDEEKYKGMHANSIRGYLLSIILKHNIPVIFTQNYKDTAKYISVLAKRKEREAPLNVKKKAYNKKEQLQYILESFPGIGPKTARKLLKEFKTIKNVLNTPLEDLKKFLGKKADIFKIIEDKY